MSRRVDLVLGIAATLTVGFVVAVNAGDLPTGVQGEWTWPRIWKTPNVTGLTTAVAVAIGYAAFVVRGWAKLSEPVRDRRRETIWVPGLAIAAVVVQVGLAIGAPPPYDLTRAVVVPFSRVATGYFEVARDEAGDDPWKFFATYPEWLARQGADHLGTHPPGFIATYRVLLSLMERNEGLAGLVVALTPPSMTEGFRKVEAAQGGPVSRADRAAVATAAFLALLAAAGSVVPVYILARASLPPAAAWVSAAAWPLAPSLNLFQPLLDTSFPLIAATALAFAAWSTRPPGGVPDGRRWIGLATASGAVMGFGMMFSLAFLPVGLIVALLVMTSPATPWHRRVATILWIGVGFGLIVAASWATTGADPFAIWWWNLKHNARFNEGGQRSYLNWLLVNLLDLAISSGLPAFAWFVVGCLGLRRAPRVVWCGLAVILLLDLSGRNLGEVARLWMLFLPALLPAVGAGFAALGGGRQALAVTVGLTTFQTLALQCLVQLVYPP